MSTETLFNAAGTGEDVAIVRLFRQSKLSQAIRSALTRVQTIRLRRRAYACACLYLVFGAHGRWRVVYKTTEAQLWHRLSHEASITLCGKWLAVNHDSQPRSKRGAGRPFFLLAEPHDKALVVMRAVKNNLPTPLGLEDSSLRSLTVHRDSLIASGASQILAVPGRSSKCVRPTEHYHI